MTTFPAASATRYLALFALLAIFFAGTSLEAQQDKRHLRHILVKSEKIADLIIQRIEGGQDFKELARKYSLDVGTRPLGGDLGWGQPQSYEADFSRAAWGIANLGDMAKAKTKFGWHVILFVDGTPGAQTPIPQPAPVAPKPPTTGNPMPLNDRNEDLAVEMTWNRSDYAPGEPMRFFITIKNQSEETLDVFNPELWPLGLLCRYQFGKLNRPLVLPRAWGEDGPPGGFQRPLRAGESLRHQFTLQDYFGEPEQWPIIRMIWRGDTLFSRLDKNFPQLMADSDYPRRKGRWRYYQSTESRASVLPRYSADEKWYVQLFTRGQVWFQIHDPGIPGLIEDFFRAVRHDEYEGKFFSQYTPQDHVAVVMEVPEDPIPFRQPTGTVAWESGTVGLSLDWVKNRPYIGRSLAIGLEKPQEISERAVSIGRIVHVAGKPLEQLESLIGGGKYPTVSLALVYPESLVPEEVRAAAAALPPPTFKTRKIDPSPRTGWKPKLAPSQGRDRASSLKGAPAPKRETPLAKDLPRVLFETERGNFTIELYEDDAPNTVANFILLVESGAYDGRNVVRKVTTDYNKGFVQMGSPDDTVHGHPGFFIRDEPNARPHVTGVVSMAKHPKRPNTGGSQFFVCLDGQPHLNGSFTPFGHIIDGIQVVDQLAKGNRIKRASIVRKRGHEYKPVRIPQN